MGKFINTEYRDTVQTISDLGKSLIKNQYYQYNDKRGIVITNYYNINTKNTSLDPGSLLDQDDLGPDSPHRFNYIEGLIMYGFPRIELDMDNGEFGLESSPIRGECYILPNVITPCEGDFFEVPLIYDGPWLWKVMKVGRDTLENGANVFKVEFVLNRTTNEEITDLIVDRFVYMDIQDGTNTKAVVENTKYQFAKKLDDICSTLKSYYSDLFFSRYVQTFVYEYVYDAKIYDPYLIEFMIRNGIMENHTDDYISVSHQMKLPRTFSIEYDHSIFRAIELSSKEKLNEFHNNWRMEKISQMASIFATRFEDYYRTIYVANDESTPVGYTLNTVLPADLMDYILMEDGILLDERKKYYNIIFKHFNHKDLTEEDIESIKQIEYGLGSDIFYLIPILIYCLENYIKKLLN